eukprot:6182723-Pleurochrysis_carterae.AAC.1
MALVTRAQEGNGGGTVLSELSVLLTKRNHFWPGNVPDYTLSVWMHRTVAARGVRLKTTAAPAPQLDTAEFREA